MGSLAQLGAHNLKKSPTIPALQLLEIHSEVGLKLFFVENLILGSIIVPALDALSVKFKQVLPGFKKKKGALHPELEQL